MAAYLVAFQLLCGAFGAFLASRKRRSPAAWFAIAFAVPVVGVILAFTVREYRRAKPGVSKCRQEQRRTLQPPKRCCRSYIPDCLGCPYFNRPLFDDSYTGERKGYCRLFGKELLESGDRKTAKITFRDEQGEIDQ